MDNLSNVSEEFKPEMTKRQFMQEYVLELVKLRFTVAAENAKNAQDSWDEIEKLCEPKQGEGG